LTGSAAPVAQRRGAVEAGFHGGPVLVSWHPAFVLRTRDAARQASLRRELAADLAALPALAANDTPAAASPWNAEQADPRGPGLTGA